MKENVLFYGRECLHYGRERLFYEGEYLFYGWEMLIYGWKLQRGRASQQQVSETWRTRSKSASVSCIPNLWMKSVWLSPFMEDKQSLWKRNVVYGRNRPFMEETAPFMEETRDLWMKNVIMDKPFHFMDETAKAMEK
jgi:hypothetical protein